MTEQPTTQAGRDLDLDAALLDIRNEFYRARRMHAPMHSGHEGWAVIREEMDELWELVRADKGDGSRAYAEAMQIAAMAVAYMIEVAQRIDTFGVFWEASPMTEQPTTQAGREHLTTNAAAIFVLRYGWSEQMEKDILAIEREAAAAERERLAASIERWRRWARQAK
jgi:hypothetical protein